MASNPSMNDDILKRETIASRSGAAAPGEAGSFTPGWGAPAAPPPAGFAGGPAAGTFGAPPSAGTPGFGATAETMRISGTLSATAILLGIVAVVGVFGWHAVHYTTFTDTAGRLHATDIHVPPALVLTLFAGMGLGFLTIFKPKLARVTGPLYAACEGYTLGAISHLADINSQGVAIQAVGVTLAIAFTMLVLYATGTIKVTDKLRSAVLAGLGGILLLFLVEIVAGLFGFHSTVLSDGGPIAIVIGLVIVVVASLNLLLNFDFMERGVAMGAPRYMEWYAGFSLVMALVFLYLEVLRLLSMLRQR